MWHRHLTRFRCRIGHTSPKGLLSFVNRGHHILRDTSDPHKTTNSPNLDFIFNLTSDETYTIAALEAGKHVMVERSLSLSLQSVQRLEAEKKAKINYMRRHAPNLIDAFEREVAGLDSILYARSRGIAGPIAFFVPQFRTSATTSSSLPPEPGVQRTELLDDLLQEAFPNQEATNEHRDCCRFLGSLGSHDLSLVRKVLGFSYSVVGVSVNEVFYPAIFNRRRNGEPFAVKYE